MLNDQQLVIMDFLCFTANHDRGYAINIEDLVYIVSNPLITSVPGTLPAVVGITTFRGSIIPVVDMSVMYSGDYESRNQKMIIFDTEHKLGVLVSEIRDIVRNEVPDGYEFLDIHDFERQATSKDSSERESHIELF